MRKRVNGCRGSKHGSQLLGPVATTARRPFQLENRTSRRWKEERNKRKEKKKERAFGSFLPKITKGRSVFFLGGLSDGSFIMTEDEKEKVKERK